MWQLAWRQLQLDVVRTTLTATALAAVVAVLLVLQGFELGLYHQLNRTALDLDTKLIALQPGVTNLLGARSSLPQLARAAVEAVDGVADAWPLTGIPVIYQQDDHKTPIYVFVYDSKGGPAQLVTGHAVEQSRDIVIDRSLAQKYQLHVGDRFTIADFDFQIAGITTGHAALFMPFAYIGYDGMLDLFLESQLAPDLSTFPLLSFLLLDLDKGASAAQVAHRVEQQVPEVDVLSSAQLGHNSVALGRAMFGPVLGLLLSVAYVIGFLVVTLIMDADVRTRRRSLVVLMALGFSATRLAGGVLQQCLLLLLIAYPLGLLIALALGHLIETLQPLYEIRFLDAQVLGNVVVASLGFAALGALLPLYMLRQTDPATALRGA